VTNHTVQSCLLTKLADDGFLELQTADGNVVTWIRDTVMQALIKEKCHFVPYTAGRIRKGKRVQGFNVQFKSCCVNRVLMCYNTHFVCVYLQLGLNQQLYG